LHQPVAKLALHRCTRYQVAGQAMIMADSVEPGGRPEVGDWGRFRGDEWHKENVKLFC
jgi:hypothetical protein